jgi:hypothetical protein
MGSVLKSCIIRARREALRNITYATRRTPEGPVIARGVNSIELFHDGRRWWIAAAIWDSERPGNPIPKDLLP